MNVSGTIYVRSRPDSVCVDVRRRKNKTRGDGRDLEAAVEAGE